MRPSPIDTVAVFAHGVCILGLAAGLDNVAPPCLLWPAHLMPSRDHYGDALQRRADPWRVPFALCLAAEHVESLDFREARGAP